MRGAAEGPFFEDDRFGLWRFVEERCGAEPATTTQERAARYLIGDMPSSARLSFEAAHELLSVRSYVVGLLISLERKQVTPHPREAMSVILDAVLKDEPMLRSILTWSRRRYLQDSGPSRVGGTANAVALSDLVVGNCRLTRPSSAVCTALRDEALRRAGFGSLLDSQRVKIVYDSSGELTTRVISAVELQSGWPDWAAYLIDPASNMTLDAYCHLRGDYRTFNLLRVQSAGTWGNISPTPATRPLPHM
jgi:hypothetical protein